MRSRWVCGALLVLMGCASRRVDNEQARLLALLADADAAWEARAEGGLDPVEAPLSEAYAISRTDAGVLWRLSRVHLYRGLAEPERRARTNEFGAARGLALACLDAESQVRQRRLDGGMERALPLLPTGRATCLPFARLSWAQWSAELGGDASALDLPELDALLAAPMSDPRFAWMDRWAEGISLAVRPRWASPNLERAAKLLGGVEGQPCVQADLLRFVQRPLGDQAVIASSERALNALAPTFPEEKVAITLALARPGRLGTPE